MKKKLEAQKAEAVAQAKAILATAEKDNREPTTEERAQVKAHLDEAKQLKTRLDDLQAVDDMRAQLTALGAPLDVAGRQAPARPVDTRVEFAAFGEFLQAVAYASMPGHQVDPRLMASGPMAASGLNTTVGAEGGYAVRTQWSDALIARAIKASVLAQRCMRIPIGDGFDGLEAPLVDETSRATGSRWGGIRVYRAADGDSVTASKPKLGRFELRLEDLKGLCYATERSLRDATSLQSIIEQGFAEEFSFVLDDEILRGDGAGRCLGILNSPALVTVAAETVPAQVADTIVAENVMKMHSRLLAKNMGGAEWFINQETLPQLYTMAITVGVGGVPVYMPANGLSAAPFGTLFGRPVNPIEQASGLGDVGDIVLADMGEYILIDKPAGQASSMHVRFIYDEMTFRWTWPVCGKPKLASKITPYKATSATSLSPFVTLAAR
jgi:HK97 family phage major capsid protein